MERPTRESSVVFVRPTLYSATQRLIIEFDGEDSSNVKSGSFFISVAVKP